MDYTQNLNLPQWEETDRIMRTDFNDAMSKIDAAVPQIEFGTYTGNDTYPRTIELGYQPQCVFLIAEDGRTNLSGNSYGGLFTPDHPLKNNYGTVTASGFRLSGGNTNISGLTYYYLTLR